MESVDFSQDPVRARSYNFRRNSDQSLIADQPQFALTREILQDPSDFLFRPACAHDQISQGAPFRARRADSFQGRRTRGQFTIDAALLQLEQSPGLSFAHPPPAWNSRDPGP